MSQAVRSKSQQTQTHPPNPPHKEVHTESKPSVSFLHNIIPKTLYNPDTKKILGLLSSEDLLIIALIFLFLDNSDEDNLLIVLALVYVLLSDHIDIEHLLF